MALIPIPVGKRLKIVSEEYLRNSRQVKDYIGCKAVLYLEGEHGRFELQYDDGKRTGWFSNETLKHFTFEKQKPLVIIHDNTI